MALNVLNFWDIFVNDIFGSPLLFLGALLIGVLIISAKSGFTQRVTLLLLTVVILIISAFIDKILAITLLIVLAGIGLAYSRVISRG